MSENATPQHGAEPSAGHELRDISFRPIVRASIGLVVLIVFSVVAMRILFSYYAAREAASSRPANPLAAEFARSEPPQPRLQTAPIEDLRKLRKLEDALLDTYGWIDRKQGVVRIPIEQAMKLAAERAVAARQGGAAGK
jgi:hypothetical protein